MNESLVLDVLLHGNPIGTLTLLSGYQGLFAFSQAYIDDPERSVLSLSFKEAMGGLITDLRPARSRLPPFFANLLPEGPLRAYLARRAGVKESDEFSLLRALGDDLPGAVTLRPADERSRPLKWQSRTGPESAMRFSIAGTQLKFPAIMEADDRLTISPDGAGGRWIVKLPSPQFARLTENEHGMMRLARCVGITVPDAELVPMEAIAGLPEDIGRLEGPALAVRRFDRTGDGAPLHIEDFAQIFALYPEQKYERATYRDIAAVLWAETGEKGVAEFIRRLVFCVLTGNGDAHLKNWSLIYPDRRTAALAPGYDFVSTIPYLPRDTLALKFGRSKRMDMLSRDQLSYFSARARLPGRLVLRTAQETAARFCETWPEERRALPHRVLAAIEEHWRHLAF